MVINDLESLGVPSFWESSNHDWNPKLERFVPTMPSCVWHGSSFLPRTHLNNAQHPWWLMTIEDFTNQYIADNHNPWGESPSTNQYRERGFEQRSFGLWMVKAFRFFCPWALGTVPTRSSYYDDWQPPQTAALLSNPGGISRSCAIETHWLGKVGSTFFEATEMGVCNTHWELTCKPMGSM